MPGDQVPGTRAGAGKLYVVSTPIGNLGDFSYRGVEVLRRVAAVLAEDTRRTRKLLDHYDIVSPLLAYHEHNEARMTARVIQRLQRGEDLALVSDAGTPLISDPGARLVSAALDHRLAVVPVPGASAVLTALVAAGFDSGEAGVGKDSGRFTYFGFLPRTGAARRTALDEVVATGHTAVLFEAPLRLATTLGELAERGAADRQAVVARELTKRFEEFRRGTVAELAAYYDEAPPRGEIVILLGPVAEKELDYPHLVSVARQLREQGFSARDVARRMSEEHSIPRNLAYRLAHGEEE